MKQPVQADMYVNWLAAIKGNMEKGGFGCVFVLPRHMCVRA